MFPNTSTQSQDLFKDRFAKDSCPRVLDYIADWEVKLGENSFNFQTGNPGKFPGKRKSPGDYSLGKMFSK